MIFVSGLKVILNKVSDLDLASIPDGIEVTVEGPSRSIYEGSGKSVRRIQGLVIKISGDKKLVDLFLKQYENTGVYLK